MPLEMRAGPQKCSQCGEPMTLEDYGVTLVGYYSPEGHNHDDNCLRAFYRCQNGHREQISHQRKCPVEGCDWMGKPVCFCHKGGKRGIWTNEIEQS